MDTLYMLNGGKGRIQSGTSVPDDDPWAQLLVPHAAKFFQKGVCTSTTQRSAYRPCIDDVEPLVYSSTQPFVFLKITSGAVPTIELRELVPTEPLTCRCGRVLLEICGPLDQ